MSDMSEMTELDLRVYPRKIFRCRAILSVEDKAPISTWTVDISMEGLSLMLTESIEPGQYCVIKFEAFHNGAPRLFSAIARSVYSVCRSAGQYRTGFQFFGLSAANTILVEALMQ